MLFDLKMQTTLSKSGFTEAGTSAGLSMIYDPLSSFTVMIRQRYTFYDFAFKLYEHHKLCDCFFCSFYSDHRRSRKIIREGT